MLIWAEAMKISEGKAARLRRLATDKGVIAALAIDQRKSLRMMIAAAAGVETEAISDSQVLEFKSAVTRILTSARERRVDRLRIWVRRLR